MSDITSLERALFTRARGALEPTEADRGRNHQQLAARIAATSLATASSVPSSASLRPLRHLLDQHLVALSIVAASVGLVAFGVGYSFGIHNQKPTVTTLIKFLPAPQSAVAATPPGAPLYLPTSPPSLTSFPDRGRGGTGAKVAASSAASVKLNDTSLSEELDLLRRAERTIRAGDSMVALGLLGELDARFPKGQMLHERAAARVMANCQLADASSAKAMGQAYLGAHAQSVYAARVRSICHLDAERSAKDSRGTGD